MKEQEKRKSLKLIEEVKMLAIVCNKCGEKRTFNRKSKEYEISVATEEFQEFNFSFGYGSIHDGEKWSFDLCENCLIDLAKTFKHVPEGFGQGTYNVAYPQKMFDHWKETGEKNLDAGMTEGEIEGHGGTIYFDPEL